MRTKVGMLPSWVGIVLLMVLAFALHPAVGEEPWYQQHPDHVVFRSRLCQPVAPTNLINMMGSHWNDHKMASAKKPDNYTKPTQWDPYTLRQRRRRWSHGNTETRSKATGNNLKDSNSILLQLLSGKDKKHQKKFKQKFPPSVNESKSPPRECKFTQRLRRMSKGVFPEWVLEGRCQTDECYEHYKCVPIKYKLMLLERDPNKCVPLPSISNITVFEERWRLIHKSVTVGCSCG